MIIEPKLLALDSRTLNSLSLDYWSTSSIDRVRSRGFMRALSDRGIYIAISLTQVVETLRHGNDNVADNRFRFLASLPMLAWLQPYDNSWFVAPTSSLHRREMHAVKHDEITAWESIVAHVRGNAWQTGIGEEMFCDDGSGQWGMLRTWAQQQTQQEKLSASITAVDPDHLMDEKLSDVKKMRRTKRSEYVHLAKKLAADYASQIRLHGDDKLESPDVAAEAFAYDTYQTVIQADADGVDLEQLLFNPPHIPDELIDENTTVGDIGHLTGLHALYSRIGKALRPPLELNLHNTTADAIPSITFELALRDRQVREQKLSSSHASGSDIGDASIAKLALYADYVEVDKRTFDYQQKLRVKDKRFEGLLGSFLKASHYTKIPEKIDALG